MGREVCFVCGDTLASIDNGGDNNWKAKKTGAALILENNLDVIFLLRKLLQVPGIQLECNLKECGDNPEDWISLCDQCTQLIKKGRELDKEIRKIEKSLKSIQRQVVEKIRAGGLRITDDKQKKNEDGYLGSSSEDFENKIRCYANKFEFEELLDKPIFLECDQLAEYLKCQENHRTAAILLVEDDQDVKVEPESPPTPNSADYLMDDEVKLDQNDQRAVLNDEEGTPETDNFSCSICERKLCSSRGLSRHMREVHLKRFQIFCPVCPEMGFPDKQHLHKHLLRKHKDEPVTKKLEEETGIFLRKCPVVGCVTRFMKQVNVDRHMARVHGVEKDGHPNEEKRHKCEYCGRGFWDRGKCRRHEKIHEEKGKVREITWNSSRNKAVGTAKIVKKTENKFKCEICGKSFKWAKKWSNHLWNKHDQRDITCPDLECGKYFNNSLVEFQEHWKTSHGGRADKQLSSPSKKVAVKKIICDLCGKRHASQMALCYHKLKIHRIGRNGQPIMPRLTKNSKLGLKFICNICGKEFSSKYSLSNHVKYVHDKQLNVSCHLCGLKFVYKAMLNMHLFTVHKDDPVTKQLEEEEGLKLFKCGVVGCSSKYLKKDAFDKHMEKFHGVGGGDGNEGGTSQKFQFQCKFCGKGFRYWKRVTRHERIHEGEGREDFKCELCGKGFSTREYLDYHLKYTHKLAKKFQKKDAK